MSSEHGVPHVVHRCRPATYGVLKVGDQHAKLGSPVADVVHTLHRVAKELQDASNGITDDGGTQVAHVHLLRDVGRRVVDHHLLGVNRRRQQARLDDVLHTCGQEGLGQVHVDEAGLHGLQAFHNIRRREGGDDFLRGRRAQKQHRHEGGAA